MITSMLRFLRWEFELFSYRVFQWAEIAYEMIRESFKTIFPSIAVLSWANSQMDIHMGEEMWWDTKDISWEASNWFLGDFCFAQFFAGIFHLLNPTRDSIIKGSLKRIAARILHPEINDLHFYFPLKREKNNHLKSSYDVKEIVCVRELTELKPEVLANYLAKSVFLFVSMRLFAY